MVDTLTPRERSVRMSRIKSRDTKPELALRKALHALGLRYRLVTKLPGKPDLVLPRHEAVVFVHGCFWHRHPGCKVATTPKSNTSFWNEKFERNVARDKKVLGELRALGWRVFVAWECELSGKGKAATVAERIKRQLQQPAEGG
ncbi:very short patch repair endonuclease [Brevundimonas sp. GCM10030266]|uniref:very short patch repair endonuclease n=1 Tax=Brevundimonas sp. GCM10030266 TaxID=3273386 RepID=UPI00360B0831